MGFSFFSTGKKALVLICPYQNTTLKRKTLHLLFYPRNNKDLTAVTKSSTFGVWLYPVQPITWVGGFVTDQQTSPVEEVSVEMAKGDVPMKLREQHRVWLTMAVAKKVTLSQHKGDQRVAFVVDNWLWAEWINWWYKYFTPSCQTSMGAVNTGLSPTQEYKN